MQTIIIPRLVRRTAVPAVLAIALAVVAGCGGGGADAPPAAPAAIPDTTNPTVAFSSASSGEVARSVSAGVTMRLAVTAGDNIAVIGVNITLTPPAGAPLTTAMAFDTPSGTWRVSTTRVPPISGFDTYAWAATARDAAGNTASTSGTFTVNGPTPPSTGGAF